MWKRRYLLVVTEECVCRDDGGREKCVRGIFNGDGEDKWKWRAL